MRGDDGGQDAVNRVPTRKTYPCEGVRKSDRWTSQSVPGRNDASKSQPDWVQAVCTRWLDESPTKETAYIVKRALRTLRKQGVVA